MGSADSKLQGSSCEDTIGYQVLIVTNDYTSGSRPLPGTKQDGIHMEEAFVHHNIKTYRETNVSRKRFLALLDEAIKHLKSKSNPSNLRFIAFVFSGHGGKGDRLVMQDGEAVDLKNEVILRYTSECHIAFIPKLFFVDACRGNEKLDNIFSKSPENAGIGGSIHEIASSEGGYLLAYATVSNSKSYMSEDGKGSTWMQRIANEIHRSGSEDSIQYILTKVNQDLFGDVETRSVKCPQQPEIINRLNCGELVINPGTPLLFALNIEAKVIMEKEAICRIDDDVIGSGGVDLSSLNLGRNFHCYCLCGHMCVSVYE